MARGYDSGGCSPAAPIFESSEGISSDTCPGRDPLCAAGKGGCTNSIPARANLPTRIPQQRHVDTDRDGTDQPVRVYDRARTWKRRKTPERILTKEETADVE